MVNLKSHGNQNIANICQKHTFILLLLLLLQNEKLERQPKLLEILFPFCFTCSDKMMLLRSNSWRKKRRKPFSVFFSSSPSSKVEYLSGTLSSNWVMLSSSELNACRVSSSWVYQNAHKELINFPLRVKFVKSSLSASGLKQIIVIIIIYERACELCYFYHLQFVVRGSEREINY